MRFACILRGEYAGKSGEVKPPLIPDDEEDADLEVVVEPWSFWGVIVPRVDCVIEDRPVTLEEMWPAVETAVYRRTGGRLGVSWGLAARGPLSDDPRGLVERLLVEERAIRRGQEEAAAAERVRFDAEFGSLPDDERDRRWLAERERWTERVNNWKELSAELGVEDMSDFFDKGRARREEETRRAYPLGAPPAPIASDPAVEAALEDSDDDHAFSVYADWLQQRGDPRGELMALAIATRDEHHYQTRQPHDPYLIGGLTGWDGDGIELRWRRGLIDRARLALPQERAGIGLAHEILEELLAVPAARFLRHLVLGPFDYHGENHYAPLVELMTARGCGTLRTLFIGDMTSEDQELSWTSAGDLGPLYAALPRLEELKVRAGSFSLGALPPLRKLVVETTCLTPRNLEEVLAAKLDGLEELVLWLGSRATAPSATWGCSSRSSRGASRSCAGSGCRTRRSPTRSASRWRGARSPTRSRSSISPRARWPPPAPRRSSPADSRT
jgi:uncharacterized protein (TIGR02996 family)